jgi:hypothetical protein
VSLDVGRLHRGLNPGTVSDHRGDADSNPGDEDGRLFSPVGADQKPFERAGLRVGEVVRRALVAFAMVTAHGRWGGLGASGAGIPRTGRM